MEINLKDVFEIDETLFQVRSMILRGQLPQDDGTIARRTDPASLTIELFETTENHQVKNMDLREVYVTNDVYDKIRDWNGVYE